MADAWAIGPGIPGDPHHDNRRRAGRLSCSMLGSSLGDVIDLSVTGMRCRSAKAVDVAVGQELEFDLDTLAGSIRLQGKIVWSVKKAWRRFEIGVQFISVTDETRRSLVEIARISTDRQCIKRSA